jgi:hypothetical protein
MREIPTIERLSFLPPNYGFAGPMMRVIFAGYELVAAEGVGFEPTRDPRARKRATVAWSGTWFAQITRKATSSRQRRSIPREERSPTQ